LPESNGYVRIEAKATSAMESDSYTPFDLDDVTKKKLGPPQTFSGLAGSEKSDYLVPELYIKNLQQLEEGAIATRYNADGTILKSNSMTEVKSKLYMN